MKRFLKNLFLLLLPVIVCGCKADPAEPTDFIQADSEEPPYEDDSMEAFQRFWLADDVKWDKYSKIYVAPVNLDYMLSRPWYDINIQITDRDEAAKKLAAMMHDEFIKALRGNPGPHKLIVTDAADAETLILELAITEISPTKVVLNAAGYVMMIGAVSKGSIAMEGRLKDASTGKYIMKFADRERGKSSLANVKDLGCYSHAESILKEWASQYVELLKNIETKKVKDSSGFELLPW